MPRPQKDYPSRSHRLEAQRRIELMSPGDRDALFEWCRAQGFLPQRRRIKKPSEITQDRLDNAILSTISEAGAIKMDRVRFVYRCQPKNAVKQSIDRLLESGLIERIERGWYRAAEIEDETDVSAPIGTPPGDVLSPSLHVRQGYSIADQLRLAREAVGLKQIDLGQMVGTNSVSHVSDWESGRSLPKVYTMELLSNALGVAFVIGVERWDGFEIEWREKGRQARDDVYASSKTQDAYMKRLGRGDLRGRRPT